MNTRTLAVVGLVLIGLAACKDNRTPSDAYQAPATTPPATATYRIGTTAPEPTATTVITTEDLARIGARIYLSPERQDAILDEADMTLETFQALIESLSQDAESAFRYAQAFEVELAR